MASRQLKVAIVGDTKGLDKAFKQSESRLQSFGKKAGVAGVAIGGGLVALMGSSAKAAAEAEKSQKSLEAQLTASGTSFKAHADQIDSVIKKHADLAAVDDEDLQDALTNLVRRNGDVTKSLDMLGTVTDVAAGKKISLVKAADLVGKASDGQKKALVALGITVDENASKMEIARAVQEKFAGQGEKSGEGAAGAARRWQNATQNLQESLGAGLLPVMTKVANAFAGVTGWLERNRTVGTALVATAGVLATALIGLSVATKVSEGLKAMAKAQELLNTATRKHPFVAVGVALVALGAALVVAYQKSETFRNVVNAAFRAVKNAVLSSIDFILGGVSSFLKGLSKVFDAAGKLPGVGGKFKGIAEDVRGAARSVDGLREDIRGLKSPPPIKIRIQALADDLSKRLLRGDPLPNLTVTPRGRQAGGLIPGSGRGDIVPALLEPGEFVMRKAIVDRFGPTFFARMNAQRFAGGGIVALGRQLQREGYQVGEHPKFGGVYPVHTRNSYHYRGLALDINGGPGGEPGSLDRLFGRLRGRSGIAELLWRVKGHFDHLHVAVTGDRNPLTGAAARAGEGITPPIAKSPVRLVAQKLGGSGHVPAEPRGNLTGFSTRGIGRGLIKTPPRLTGPGAGAPAAARPAAPVPNALQAALAGDPDAIPAQQSAPTTTINGQEYVLVGAGRNKMWVSTATVLDRVRKEIDGINLRERAGRLTAQQAHLMRRDVLVRALAGGFGWLTEDERLQIEGDLRELDQQAAAAAAAAVAPDLQAQLDQANLKVKVAERAAALAGASGGVFVGAGDIGYGIQGRAPVTIIQTLHPSDPRTLDAIASANARAWDAQGGRTATAHISGV